MIQIIHTPTSIVNINGEDKYTRTTLFPDGVREDGTIRRCFERFDDFLKESEEKGYIKCYIYSIWTQHEKDPTCRWDEETKTQVLLYPNRESTLLWVRYLLSKE